MKQKRHVKFVQHYIMLILSLKPVNYVHKYYRIVNNVKIKLYVKYVQSIIIYLMTPVLQSNNVKINKIIS